MGLPYNFFDGRYKPSKLSWLISPIVLIVVYLTVSDRINNKVGFIIIFVGIILLFVDLMKNSKS